MADHASTTAARLGAESVRLRAEVLAVFACNQLGRGAAAGGRALRAYVAARAAGEETTERLIRVELAACAADASAPAVGLSVLRPALDRGASSAATARAAAFVTAADCVARLGGGPEVAALLKAADELYDTSRSVEPDAVLLRRGIVHARLAAYHRRLGDHVSAESAARLGIALIEDLADDELDTGQVSGALMSELVMALLDGGRAAEAVLAAQPMLRRPTRPAGAATSCWLRLALVSRVHLPAGRHVLARRLLAEAAADAERNQLDPVLAECRQLQAQVYEMCAEVGEALQSVRAAHIAERRWRDTSAEFRTLLAAEFGRPGPAADLRSELAAVLAAFRATEFASRSSRAARLPRSRHAAPTPLPIATAATNAIGAAPTEPAATDPTDPAPAGSGPPSTEWASTGLARPGHSDLASADLAHPEPASAIPGHSVPGESRPEPSSTAQSGPMSPDQTSRDSASVDSASVDWASVDWAPVDTSADPAPLSQGPLGSASSESAPAAGGAHAAHRFSPAHAAPVAGAALVGEAARLTGAARPSGEFPFGTNLGGRGSSSDTARPGVPVPDTNWTEGSTPGTGRPGGSASGVGQVGGSASGVGWPSGSASMADETTPAYGIPMGAALAEFGTDRMPVHGIPTGDASRFGPGQGPRPTDRGPTASDTASTADAAWTANAASMSDTALTAGAAPHVGPYGDSGFPTDSGPGAGSGPDADPGGRAGPASDGNARPHAGGGSAVGDGPVGSPRAASEPDAGTDGPPLVGAGSTVEDLMAALRSALAVTPQVAAEQPTVLSSDGEPRAAGPFAVQPRAGEPFAGEPRAVESFAVQPRAGGPVAAGSWAVGPTIAEPTAGGQPARAPFDGPGEDDEDDEDDLRADSLIVPASLIGRTPSAPTAEDSAENGSTQGSGVGNGLGNNGVEREAGRHRSDVGMADLLTEALMAYQNGRRSQLAAGVDPEEPSAGQSDRDAARAEDERTPDERTPDESTPDERTLGDRHERADARSEPEPEPAGAPYDTADVPTGPAGPGRSVTGVEQPTAPMTVPSPPRPRVRWTDLPRELVWREPGRGRPST